jgi:GH24 family phage-related lysozyme (muramidase)
VTDEQYKSTKSLIETTDKFFEGLKVGYSNETQANILNQTIAEQVRNKEGGMTVTEAMVVSTILTGYMRYLWEYQPGQIRQVAARLGNMSIPMSPQGTLVKNVLSAPPGDTKAQQELNAASESMSKSERVATISATTSLLNAMTPAKMKDDGDWTNFSSAIVTVSNSIAHSGQDQIVSARLLKEVFSPNTLANLASLKVNNPNLWEKTSNQIATSVRSEQLKQISQLQSIESNISGAKWNGTVYELAFDPGVFKDPAAVVNLKRDIDKLYGGSLTAAAKDNYRLLYASPAGTSQYRPVLSSGGLQHLAKAVARREALAVINTVNGVLGIETGQPEGSTTESKAPAPFVDPLKPKQVQEESLGGVLGLGGFPDTGTPPGERAVAKANVDVAKLLISPAAAAAGPLDDNRRFTAIPREEVSRVVKSIPKDLGKLPVQSMLYRVAELEGKANKPYKLPGEEHYTVGYGHNGPDVDPNKEYSNEEIEELLKKDSVKFLRLMTKELPDLDSYSEDLKVELFQAFYRGDFPKISPKALKALKEGDFGEAADEFLNNKEYKNAEDLGIPGIRPRMEAVADAIREEGLKVNASGSSSFVSPANAADGGDQAQAQRFSEQFADLPSRLPSKPIPVPIPRPTPEGGQTIVPRPRPDDPNAKALGGTNQKGVPIPRPRPSASLNEGLTSVQKVIEGAKGVNGMWSTGVIAIAHSLLENTIGPAGAFFFSDVLDTQAGGQWRSITTTSFPKEYTSALYKVSKLASAEGRTKLEYSDYNRLAVAHDNQDLVDKYYGGSLVDAAIDKFNAVPPKERPKVPTNRQSLDWGGGLATVIKSIENPYVNMQYTIGSAAFTKEGGGFRVKDQYDNQIYKDYTQKQKDPKTGEMVWGKVYGSTEEFLAYKRKSGKSVGDLWRETKKAVEEGKVGMFGLIHNTQFLYGSKDFEDNTQDTGRKIDILLQELK